MENKLFINFKFNNNEIGTLDIAINDKDLKTDTATVIDFSGAEPQTKEPSTEPTDAPIETNTETKPHEETAKRPEVVSAQGRRLQRLNKKSRICVTDYKGINLALLKRCIVGFYELKRKGKIHTAIKVKSQNSFNYFYIPMRFTEILKLYNETPNE